jgi:hypothetical protein
LSPWEAGSHPNRTDITGRKAYPRFGWDGVYDELVRNCGYKRSLEGMYRAATRIGLGWGGKRKPPKIEHEARLDDWLVIPSTGAPYPLRYAFFWYKDSEGNKSEHPVYCIEPEKGGAYEFLTARGPNPDDGSQTATYIRRDKVSDTA